MNNKEIVKVLKRARALLAKRGGWIKGNSFDNEGGYCATGAIYSAMEPAPTLISEKLIIYQELASQLPDEYSCGTSRCDDIRRFNDDPKTTKRQVIALFDKAIKATTKKQKGK